MKNENKTQPTKQKVSDFIEAIEDEKRRTEAQVLLKLFKKVTGMKPKMWGPSIIGFGSYHYKYATGREGDWLITGFSPRKAKHSIYIMTGFKRYEELMQKLGKYKTGVSCLYVNKLADIDMEILEELIGSSVEYMQSKYETQSS